MKMIIVGHGRHGKDTVAEILNDQFDMRFQSSSWVAAEQVCRPWMSNLGYTYSTLAECYDDRHNHRQAWYEAILAYNTPDKTRLCKQIFAKSDLYVGMRDRDEFLASEKLADLTIWVDAFERLPHDDTTCKVLRSDADVIIDNSTTLDDLETRVCCLASQLLQKDPRLP